MSDAKPSPELPLHEILAAIRGSILANGAAGGSAAAPQPAPAPAEPEAGSLAPRALPVREKTLGRDIRLGAGERTLEDIVCDLLQPLLRSWLDDNLPQIAERLVLAEITRIAGGYGRP